jgi:nucleoside-diphosphate-sugar epimerase
MLLIIHADGLWTRMVEGNFYDRMIDMFMQEATKAEPLTAYGNGRQTRPFTYFSDTVDALLLLISNVNAREMYKVGNDQGITMINLARLILEIKRRTSEIEFLPVPYFGQMRISGRISRLRSLGFSHEVPLKEAIESMIKDNVSNVKLKTR